MLADLQHEMDMSQTLTGLRLQPSMQAFSTDALLHLLRLGSSAWGPYCLAAMPIVYFAFFLYFLAIGYYQQHSRPVYHDLRAAVILFRLQVRAGHSSGLSLISSASCSHPL